MAIYPDQGILKKSLETQARITGETKVITSNEPWIEILKHHSADASCVLLGFKIPEESEEIQRNSTLEMMAENMPTTLFVNSIGSEDMLA